MAGAGAKVKSSWAVCVVVAAGLVAAAPATAQLPDDAFRANPDKAGVGTHLTADLRISEDPQADGQAPRHIFIDLAAGFLSDSRARSERCSLEQAAALECPDSSKIGSGIAHATLIHVSGASQPLVADVEAFLAPPQQFGDLSGVVFQIEERTTGQPATIIGRVVRTIDSPYGIGFWAENLDELSADVPPGFSVRVDRLTSTIGASHTVRKKAYKYVRRNGKKKRVGYYKNIRYDLTTNPRKCPSSGWPWSVRIVYLDGTESVRQSSMACSP
jgi:hypothetical protein